ncbi:MAG TPA: NADH-quinone oxidoreductase subunit C [Coriobacteriia bacterium]
MPAHPPADILALAGIAAEEADEKLGAVVRLDAARIDDALAALQTVGYDFLVDLFGTDTGEAIELTYHLRAFATREDLYLKATVVYDGEAPSVWHIFPAALYPEREAAELLGMSFPGHPNPKRLLTTDELPPMLRKEHLIRTAEEVQLPYE